VNACKISSHEAAYCTYDCQFIIILRHFVEEIIVAGNVPNGNKTRSIWPGGKYHSIRQTKIWAIQTGIFGRMERAQRVPKKIKIG